MGMQVAPDLFVGRWSLAEARSSVRIIARRRVRASVICFRAASAAANASRAVTAACSTTTPLSCQSYANVVGVRARSYPEGRRHRRARSGCGRRRKARRGRCGSASSPSSDRDATKGALHRSRLAILVSVRFSAATRAASSQRMAYRSSTHSMSSVAIGRPRLDAARSKAFPVHARWPRVPACGCRLTSRHHGLPPAACRSSQYCAGAPPDICLYNDGPHPLPSGGSRPRHLDALVTVRVFPLFVTVAGRFAAQASPSRQCARATPGMMKGSPAAAARSAADSSAFCSSR